MHKYEVIIYGAMRTGHSWPKSRSFPVARPTEIPNKRPGADRTSYRSVAGNGAEFGDSIPEPKGERLMLA